MLEKLIINNIALIERLELDLGRGFTVLTGETGAGKSIIIDAVNLALGGRASRELISNGKQSAKVEAFFNVASNKKALALLDSMQLEPEDGVMTVMREINLQGKSVCRLCGEVVQLAAVKQITSLLVDVHGQHEHQSLLDEQNHLGVIDAYAGEAILPLKAETERLYNDYSSVTAALNAGFMSEAERERRIDILNYQINEITAAALKPDEESAINEELKLLTNAERITADLNTCVSALSGEGTLESVKKASDALASVANFAPQFSETSSRLSDLYYELEDIAYSVRGVDLDTRFDPRRIDALELRLDVIDGLKHKYGRTVAEVLEFLSSVEEELSRLTGSAEERERLTKKQAELKKAYFAAAQKLTEARKASADKLCSLAEQELKSLGMKHARLAANFQAIDSEPHASGMDTAALQLSANVGEPLKPLAKVASGGELSRIMLALKTVISEADGIPTLIFDEVDSGISGSTANTVGLRMKTIAKSHQVLCVTHLPQIAAFADAHYLVEKSTADNKTTTHVTPLDDVSRVAELARIMGAESGSEAALKHAGELIEKARNAVL